MTTKTYLIAAISAALAMLASAVSATDYSYVGDNHSWSIECNPSGMVLQTQYPVTRFHEAGAASSVSHDRETLYLGRSCDASHSVLGEGKWCWANGGFIAEFETNKIGFPRQELNCPKSEEGLLSCRC